MKVSEGELIRWGERIGQGVRPPVFLALRGPVGAGKSVLARAIARGAGVEGAVPSPTFNLLFRYPTGRGIDIVHLDLYRVAAPDELFELGWEELGAPDELVVIEWPEQAEEFLPSHRWEIGIDPVEDDRSLRFVSVVRVGSPPRLPGFPVQLTT